MEPIEIFRDRLRRFVEARGSKAYLAKVTGLSRTSIDQYLKGAEPEITSLTKIARAMQVEPWELLKPTTDQPVADELFIRLLALWPKLNHAERGSVLGVAEALVNAKLGSDPANPVSKNKKSGA